MLRRTFLIGLVAAGVCGVVAGLSFFSKFGAAWRPAEVMAEEAVTTYPATEPASEHGAMRYIYNAPESLLDKRYEYHWEILRTALERTKGRYGPYVMEPAVFMSEKRQTFELEKATGKLTVMYLGTKPEFERELAPVRIPVDKNLGGYMVFLIRKEDQAKFAAVRTVEDLKKFKIGLGLGWLDVDILRADGFQVVTGSSYDGLFDMLVNKRFDAFSRAAVEILGEYAERKEKIPDMAIEQTLLLYYPLPMYFWFSKTAEGERLAERAREGMMGMIEDGTYDRIFMKYQKWKIEELRLKERRVLRVENPLLGPETPLGDKRLWFDPTEAR
ncbi:MAG TPA: ABC transporter substrate-binding protein [Phycisphaerae bacterium]|nr:ABC transporter substrate-binding protein [Phycisphaerae bacterium]